MKPKTTLKAVKKFLGEYSSMLNKRPVYDQYISEEEINNLIYKHFIIKALTS